jgi:hypothetical protein
VGIEVMIALLTCNVANCIRAERDALWGKGHSATTDHHEAAIANLEIDRSGIGFFCFYTDAAAPKKLF